jgi:S1-C subfamily serine protease
MTLTAIVLLAVLACPSLVHAVPAGPGPVSAPAGGLPAYAQKVLPAVVGVKTQIPLDRPSVLTLGPIRWGGGIIFDADGHTATVGYVLTDAALIQVSLRDGRVVPARLVAQDFESGIGIIKLEGAGPWPFAPLGNSAAVHVGDPGAILGVSSDNEVSVTQTSVQEIKPFTGYWEYLLERAFIVAPANPSWGGSPLINAQGEIIGVTSLRLGEPPHVNLAIPIEYFTAHKDELLKEGRVKARRPRPWLGIYTVETERGLAVAGASPSGPALEASFERGDILVRLNGEKIESQADFYRKLWKTEVGSELNLLVLRESRFQVITLRSIDRSRISAPVKP